MIRSKIAILASQFKNEKQIYMKTLLFLGNLGGTEIIIIALVVLLLFGGKKIPELMGGLGKGVKSFKDGMKNIEKDLEEDTDNTPDNKNKE